MKAYDSRVPLWQNAACYGIFLGFVRFSGLDAAHGLRRAGASWALTDCICAVHSSNSSRAQAHNGIFRRGEEHLHRSTLSDRPVKAVGRSVSDGQLPLNAPVPYRGRIATARNLAETMMWDSVGCSCRQACRSRCLSRGTSVVAQ